MTRSRRSPRFSRFRKQTQRKLPMNRRKNLQKKPLRNRLRDPQQKPPQNRLKKTLKDP